MKDPLIEQFQITEDRLNEAWTSDNIEVISKYLSDDWVLLEPQHGIVSKERFLQIIHNKELSHSSMMKNIVQVKILGDVAVVTTRGFNKGSFRGELFDSEQWVTNIYKQENDDWVCVMTQEAPVRCG